MKILLGTIFTALLLTSLAFSGQQSTTTTTGDALAHCGKCGKKCKDGCECEKCKKGEKCKDGCECKKCKKAKKDDALLACKKCDKHKKKDDDHKHEGDEDHDHDKKDLLVA